eukprot:403372932
MSDKKYGGIGGATSNTRGSSTFFKSHNGNGDDSDSYEQFEMDDNDNALGCDIHSDKQFKIYDKLTNINRPHKRQKQGKEDAIYGVFNEGKDYFEDRNFSKGKHSGSGFDKESSTKSFNVGVAFVKSKQTPVQQPKAIAKVTVHNPVQKTHKDIKYGQKHVLNQGSQFSSNNSILSSINKKKERTGPKKSVKFNEEVQIKEFEKDIITEADKQQHLLDELQAWRREIEQSDESDEVIEEIQDPKLDKDFFGKQFVNQPQTEDSEEKYNSEEEKEYEKELKQAEESVFKDQAIKSKTTYNVILPKKRPRQELEQEDIVQPQSRQGQQNVASDLPVGFGRLGSAQHNKQVQQKREQIADHKQKKQVEQTLEQKYGKGVKLLQFMGGYKIGEGLGKHNQGIVNPIEEQKRKGNECIGASGPVKEDKKVKEQPNIAVASEDQKSSKEQQEKQQRVKLDQEDTEFLNLLKMSQKQSGKIPRQVTQRGGLLNQFNTQKYAPQISEQATVLKIIDMRGENLQSNQISGNLLTDLRQLSQSQTSKSELYHSINQPQLLSQFSKPREKAKSSKFGLFDQAFELKEKLKHQLQTVINSKTYNEGLQAQLQNEKENISEQFLRDQEKKAILIDFKMELEKIIKKVQESHSSQSKHQDGNTHYDYQSLIAECYSLYEKYPENYNQYNSSILIAKTILSQPYIKSQFLRWDVISQPLLMFDEIYQIRNLLTVGKSDHGKSQSFSTSKNGFLSHYDQDNFTISNPDNDYKNEDIMYWIFDNYWMHPMRTFISTKWQVKSSESGKLADSLQRWSLIMPERFYDKVIQLYLKPKLKREIEEWIPKDTSEDNLIQNWLLPWKNLLSQHDLQPLIVQLKLKLSTALSDWKPDQPLALTLLKPLSQVDNESKDLAQNEKPFLDHQSLQNILMRNVIPKLTYSLKEYFIIDPANQDIQPLVQLFEWVDIIDKRTLISLLREHVLNKWIQALEIWLQQIVSLKQQSEETKEEIQGDIDDVLEEIVEWYKGWKSFIPEQVRYEKEIEEVFKIAVYMIDSKL